MSESEAMRGLDDERLIGLAGEGDLARAGRAVQPIPQAAAPDGAAAA